MKDRRLVKGKVVSTVWCIMWCRGDTVGWESGERCGGSVVDAFLSVSK